MSIEIDTRVAAAVLRQNPKLMRQEFTRVLGRKQPAQSGRRLAFHFRDLLYFRLKASLEETGVALKPEDRQELYAVIMGRDGQLGRWRRFGQQLQRNGDTPIAIDLSRIAAHLHTEWRDYVLGRAQIETRPEVCSGQPVFKGTRVPVAQMVAMIRRGVPLPEIAEDYPGIDRAALNYAAIEARMGNAPGRPAKDLQVRRRPGEAAH
jgi:uncharacterized protein (DUF433 family)